MKKIISVMAVSAVLVSSLFAFDLSVGLKGLAGIDNSGVDGVLAGGGVDLNMNMYNGLGIQIESNIITSALTTGDGLNCEDHFTVNIPVMGYYNYRFNKVSIGAGAGLGCTISDSVAKAGGTDLKMGLVGGINAKYFVTDDVAIVIGATGMLDSFPTLVRTTSGNSTNYKFVSSDFSRNSVYGSIGVMYKFPMGK